MSAADLLAALNAAWAKVRTVPGWETRGGSWARGEPVGVMEHHTALPVPYPVDRLYGSLLKCNINTKPDGTIWLVAYEAPNYSSGLGSSVVLAEVLAGRAPTENARERGLADDMNGNPYFWGLENDHPGDGSPLPAIQHEAIVVATRVANEHFGLIPAQDISHAEWTTRKRDPYWNGSLRAIEAIRRDVELSQMRLPAERRADVAAMLAKGWVEGALTYYFPVEGEPSADLPADVWVNLTLAGIGGAARLGTEGRTPAEIRRIVSDAIANG